MIKNIVHQFQEAARAELKNEYPELRDKEIELKAQKIEDRTGKDVQDTLNELNMRL
jgi:vacuolar-type H+-ATPase subunit H